MSDDKQYDWVARYESIVRVVPLGIGAVGTVGVLLNRFLSQASSPVLPCGMQLSSSLILQALTCRAWELQGILAPSPAQMSWQLLWQPCSCSQAYSGHLSRPVALHR